jgi:hypothetical protein
MATDEVNNARVSCRSGLTIGGSRYKLRGLICHDGSTTSGHYYTVLLLDDHTLAKFSDASVTLYQQECAPWQHFEKHATMVFLSPEGVAPPRCPSTKRKAPAGNVRIRSRSKRADVKRKGPPKSACRISDESGDLSGFPDEIQKVRVLVFTDVVYTLAELLLAVECGSELLIAITGYRSLPQSNQRWIADMPLLQSIVVQTFCAAVQTECLQTTDCKEKGSCQCKRLGRDCCGLK